MTVSHWSQAASKPLVNKDEQRYVKKGDAAFRKSHLDKALEYYKKALEVNPTNCYANFQAGTIYFITDSVKTKGLPYFINTIKYTPAHSEDSIIDAYYYIGYCYMLEEKYDSAAIAFRTFRSHIEDDRYSADIIKEMNRVIQECNTAPALLRKPYDSVAYAISGKLQPISIKNIGYGVNSAFPEYSQILLDRDSTIMFTSRRPGSQQGRTDEITGEYYEDTYISRKDENGQWTTPELYSKHLKIKHSKLHMATVDLSPDGNTLFIYKNGDILESKRQANNEWSKPVDLSRTIKKLKRYFMPSAFLSDDGTELLLVSDAKGGYGGRDIYVCTLESNGTWSQPTNLGPVINTSEDEDSPFLTPDNKTLFFSSKGHGGLGGYDVFVSHATGFGQWSTPQNLGAPINSPADDIYFTYNDSAMKGYFSSSRVTGGFGDMDIYSFDIGCNTLDKTILQGKILAEGNQGLNLSGLRMVDISSKKSVNLTINENGEYSVKLKTRHKYKMEISYPGYVSYSMGFTTPSQCSPYPLYQVIQLSRIKDTTVVPIGQKLVVKDGFYRLAEYSGRKNARTDADLGSVINHNNDTGSIYEMDTVLTMVYTKSQKDSLFPPSVILAMSTNTATTTYTSTTNPATTYTSATNPAATYTSTTNPDTSGNNPALTYTTTTNPATTYTSTSNPATTYTSTTNPATTYASGNGTDLAANPNSIVYFKLNSHKVEKTYYPFLNSISTLMKGNRKMKLRINGYTDDIGTPDYNKRLSLLRAKAVAKYLYHKGIVRSRIRMKGWGANNFAAPNDGTHNPLNRRVEVKFIK